MKMHDILQSVRGAKIKIGLFRVQYCLDCAFLQKLQFLAIRMREKRRKIRNSAFEAMQKRKFTKNVIFCCSRGEYESKSNSTWKCLYFMFWVVIMMNAPHFSLRRLEKNSHFRSEMWSIYIVDVVWIVSTLFHCFKNASVGWFLLVQNWSFFLNPPKCFRTISNDAIFFQTRKKSMHWKKQSSIRKKGEQLKFGLCCTLSENGTRTSERYRVWHPLSDSIYDQLLYNFYLLSMFEMWIMLRDAWHL